MGRTCPVPLGRPVEEEGSRTMGDKNKSDPSRTFLKAFLLAFSILFVFFLSAAAVGYKMLTKQLTAAVPEQAPAASQTVQSNQAANPTQRSMTAPAAQSQDQSNDWGNSSGQTYSHDFSNGRLLGSRESDKYHCKDCIAAQKILPGNEVWFDSTDNAAANNYKPCGICYK